jgi:dUTP pyrophosphatase
MDPWTRCICRLRIADATLRAANPNFCREAATLTLRYPAKMIKGHELQATASLNVKLLDGSAKIPTVAHPGEDIGYDLYANGDHTLVPGRVHRVPTGVAVAGMVNELPLGFLVKDRSSMASKGVFTHGGVIDSSYRGEIVVLMTTLADIYEIRSGDRIAQLVPTPVLTGTITESSELTGGARGSQGFGSSGR